MPKKGEGVGIPEGAMREVKYLKLRTEEGCLINEGLALKCRSGRRNISGKSKLLIGVPLQTPVRLQGGEEIIPQKHGDIGIITLDACKVPTTILIGDQYVINRDIPYHDPVSLIDREELQIISPKPIKTALMDPRIRFEEVLAKALKRTSPKT